MGWHQVVGGANLLVRGEVADRAGDSSIPGVAGSEGPEGLLSVEFWPEGMVRRIESGLGLPRPWGRLPVSFRGGLDSESV